MTINLDEIEKALGEATPGPWECDERVGCISVHPKQDANCICDVTDQVAYWNGFMEDGCWNVKQSDSKNAHLIANAPEWLRKLVEQNRAILARNEELQRRVDRLEMALTGIKEESAKFATDESVIGYVCIGIYTCAESALSKEQDDV